MHSGITFDGKHSYADFGLTIDDDARSIGNPKRQIISESVPFMNSDYDFSNISGYSVYEDREIKYIFDFYAPTRQAFWEKRIQLETWLLKSNVKIKLQDDDCKPYYFMAKCTDIQIKQDDLIGQATVTFIADPYMYKDSNVFDIVKLYVDANDYSIGFINRSANKLKYYLSRGQLKDLLISVSGDVATITFNTAANTAYVVLSCDSSPSVITSVLLKTNAGKSAELIHKANKIFLFRLPTSAASAYTLTVTGKNLYANYLICRKISQEPQWSESPISQKCKLGFIANQDCTLNGSSLPANTLRNTGDLSQSWTVLKIKNANDTDLEVTIKHTGPYEVI